MLRAQLLIAGLLGVLAVLGLATALRLARRFGELAQPLAASVAPTSGDHHDAGGLAEYVTNWPLLEALGYAAAAVIALSLALTVIGLLLSGLTRRFLSTDR